MTTPAFDDSAVHRTLAVAYGVLCHSHFVAGVGAMTIAMFFGMSRSLGLRPTPWDLIANALLLIQFPVAHTFLLTSKGRSVLSHLAPQRIGSRLATTTYAAINQPGDPGGDDRYNEIPRDEQVQEAGPH